MTKSITLVNTSNWENEDFTVEIDKTEKIRLRPAEKAVITYEGKKEISLRIVDEESDDRPATPFRLETAAGVKGAAEQLLPVVTVGFECQRTREYN